jgi:hypothetical protein
MNCPIAFPDHTGIFAVIAPNGDVLTKAGEWSPNHEDAHAFDTVEEARAARPGHADGTAKSRVVFASQIRKFQLCGCLR